MTATTVTATNQTRAAEVAGRTPLLKPTEATLAVAMALCATSAAELEEDPSVLSALLRSGTAARRGSGDDGGASSSPPFHSGSPLARRALDLLGAAAGVVLREIEAARTAYGGGGGGDGGSVDGDGKLGGFEVAAEAYGNSRLELLRSIARGAKY